MDHRIFKEDIRVRLPAVSNKLSGVKSDMEPLGPEYEQGQASSVHSLPVDTTSFSPYPPPLPSAPPRLLPSLPTPEQRKILLSRHLRAFNPQPQYHHKTGSIKKDNRPEKDNKAQPLTPPPPLSKPSPVDCSEND